MQFPAVVTASGPTTFCAGSTGTALFASPVGIALACQWQFSTTGTTYTTITGATNSNYVPPITGYYRVIITNTSTSGSCTSSGILITVNPVPTVTISPAGPLSICPGSTTLLCANACSGCIYTWHTGSAVLSSLSSCFSVSAPGSYGVSITSAAGCTGSYTGSVIVSYSPVPPAPTVVTPVNYCQGAIASPLTPTVSVGATIGWYPSSTGGALLPGSTLTPVTTVPGIFNFWVTQTLICESPRSQITVNVFATPAKPTASGNTPVCAGDTLFLSASSTLSAPRFNWTGPNSFSDTLQNTFVPNVTGADSGVYRVTASLNGCPSLPDSVIVAVTCLDSVWAGDADFDKIVDNLDALEIALCLSSTGPARAGATTAWQPEHCADWTMMLPSYTTVNRKHADCDGDGIVGYSDTLAVAANYGLTHPKGVHIPAAKISGLPDLYFDLSGITPVPGTTISVPIMLGTAITPMPPVAGIAARIMIDGVTPTDTAAMSFAGSWLGAPGNTLRFAKGINNNRVDWTYARTDQHNISGEGLLGYVTFTLPSGSEGQQMKLYFDEVRIVDSSGSKITGFNTLDDSVAISSATGISSGGNQYPTQFLISPNPSTGACSAHLNLPLATRYKIEIRDLTGKLMWRTDGHGKKGQQSIVLATAGLSAGIYLVSFRGEALPAICKRPAKYILLNGYPWS